MFSVPGNQYAAIALLTSESGSEIRSRVGITNREHVAIKKIGQRLLADAAKSIAAYEGASRNECKSIVCHPSDVLCSKGVDDCDEYTVDDVCLRVWQNTGANSVNVSIDEA